MKKLSSLYLAAVLILVSAGSLCAADLKINGEYRVRGYSYSSVTGQDYGVGDSADYIDQRFLLTGTVTQGMTKGVVELDLNGGPNNGGTAWGTSYGTNLTGSLHQAYLDVTLSPMASLMAGRRMVKLGHGIILNDTADNLALTFPLQVVSLDLAYLKIKDPDSVNNPNSPLNDTDNSAYMANLNFKPADNEGFSLFYITDTQKEPGSQDNDTKNVFGVTFDGNVGPVAALIEYDNIGGTHSANGVADTNYKGQNLLIAVHGNVGVAEVGIGYLRVTGASAGSTDTSSNSISGDFVGGHGILLTDQNRYYGGVNLDGRVADANYGSPNPPGSPQGPNPALNNNFHALKLFAETMPTPDMNVGLEYFPLIKLVDGAILQQAIQQNFGPTFDTNADTNIGQEINLYGTYRLDKNLSVSGVIAYFMTSDVIKDLAEANAALELTTGSNKNVTKLNAALTYTF
jgi:hypothetical protein